MNRIRRLVMNRMQRIARNINRIQKGAWFYLIVYSIAVLVQYGPGGKENE